MRPTNNQPVENPRLADRDNPLAWKRATKIGKLRAHELLASLTEDEVARYMQVATDQIRREERWWALKIASALTALVLWALLVRQGFAAGFGKWVIAGLGLALAMGYWPWRVMKCRQLWQRHYDAAHAELSSRRTPV